MLWVAAWELFDAQRLGRRRTRPHRVEKAFFKNRNFKYPFCNYWHLSHR